MRVLLVALLVAPLAGCASETASTEPVRTLVLQNLGKAIPAGDTFWHEFSLHREGVADFSVVGRDQSSFDVGILRAEDYAEHQLGEPVDGWAWHNDVNSVTSNAELPVGAYRILVTCKNSFADCDVTVSLATTQ